MKTVCVIPARGQSKGIPRKNLRPLGGKPLIVWSIQAALGARNVERVVVSTEDEEIAAVARAHGAEVFIRPMELASDTASTESALLHVLEVLAAEGYDADILAFMQCTTPFTEAADVEGVVGLVLGGADCALAASPDIPFLWSRAPDGIATALNHDASFRKRRQEIEPSYVEHGAVYAMGVPGFLERRHRFFGRVAIHPVPHERSVDIDEIADFLVAEAMLAARSVAARAETLPWPAAAVVTDIPEDSWPKLAIDTFTVLGIGLFGLASAEMNMVVSARSAERRRELFLTLCRRHNLDPAKTVFLGHQASNLPCLSMSGCGVASAEADHSLKSVASIVLDASSGSPLQAVADLFLMKRAHCKDL